MKCINNSERWCLLSIYIFPALCCVYHVHCGFYFPHFPDELKHRRWFGHMPKVMWSLCCLTRIRIWWSHSPCQPLLHSTFPLRPLALQVSACSASPPAPLLAGSLSLFKVQRKGPSSGRLSLTTLPVWWPPDPRSLSQHPSLHSHHHMKIFAELFFDCLAHRSMNSKET